MSYPGTTVANGGVGHRNTTGIRPEMVADRN